jgi:DNA-binding transcriptional MerR regulator
LSVKILRHYHHIGLLESVDVDRATGYRRYSIDQISTAQIIRRFRALEMPLDDIGTVMSTTDLRQRNEPISAQQRIDPEIGRSTHRREQLWYVAAPADRVPVDPVLAKPGIGRIAGPRTRSR